MTVIDDIFNTKWMKDMNDVYDIYDVSDMVYGYPHTYSSVWVNWMNVEGSPQLNAIMYVNGTWVIKCWNMININAGEGLFIN